MMQTLLVLALFLLACFYLGRQLWRAFFAKQAGCEGCAIAQLHRMQQVAHSPEDKAG